MRGFPLTCLVVLYVCCAVLPLHAAPVALGGDLNSDGVSDMVVITIGAGGDLDWTTYSGADGRVLAESRALGKLGDHIAVANWLSASRANLGYISLVAGQGPQWVALRDDGTTAAQVFGAERDIVVSGADFNGNRIADAAVISVRPNGNYRWTVKRDPFVGQGSTVSVRFGRNGDVPFFASGDGRSDWLGFVRQHSAAVEVHLQTLGRRSRKQFTLPAGVWGGIRPLRLRQGARPDLLAFPVREGGVTKLSFVNMRGRIMNRAELSGEGELLQGAFDSGPGAALVMQGAAAYTIYNPRSRKAADATWGQGIAVDDININQFFAPAPTPTPIPTATPVERRPVEDNPAPPSGTLAQICTHMHPMNTSVLYKPASQGTNDARTGKPVFLWYEWENHPWTERLYVLASNGQVIGAMGLYTPGGPPWVLYYSGYAPGTMDTPRALARKAQAAAGNTKIYFYTKNGNCWGGCSDPNARCAGR